LLEGLGEEKGKPAHLRKLPCESLQKPLFLFRKKKKYLGQNKKNTLFLGFQKCAGNCLFFKEFQGNLGENYQEFRGIFLKRKRGPLSFTKGWGKAISTDDKKSSVWHQEKGSSKKRRGKVANLLTRKK